MKEYVSDCANQWRERWRAIAEPFLGGITAIVLGVMLLSCWNAWDRFGLQLGASELSDQNLVAYNIDLGMDRARGEQTIEYYGETYGEPLRDIVEQTIRNNENHPESKSTAKNSYKRESTLNDVLPEKRNNAFSQDTLSNLRKTKNPKDVLK